VSSVYKTSSGKYVASKSMGKDAFGKRVRPTFYGDTKKEAEDKLNTFLFEYKAGIYAKPKKDTLISFLREYCEACNSRWEDTTKELYHMYIGVHFEPYFKEMKLSDVKPNVLDKFYNYKLTTQGEYEVVKKGKRVVKKRPAMSINSVRKLNTFLKAAFNYAIVNKQMRDNPTAHVLLAKKINYKPTVYDEKQFADLLDDVAGTDDEIPILFAGSCGFRRGEVFGVRWKDVNLDKKTITVEKTRVRFKTNIEKKPKNETSSRTITAPGHVITALKLYKVRCKRKEPNDLVITRWRPQSYSQHFKKLLARYNLVHIRFHDLRHYNAVIMCKYGISDKVAADRLGHSTVTTLRKVYQHVLNDMDVYAADQIDSSMQKKNSHQVLKA
jgi:integrase